MGYHMQIDFVELILDSCWRISADHGCEEVPKVTRLIAYSSTMLILAHMLHKDQLSSMQL